MKFPKLFGKKKDDDEDDFDEDDFDIEELEDDLHEDDVDDELEEAVMASTAAATAVDDDEYEPEPRAQPEDLHEDEDDTHEDEEMVGEDGAGENPFDGADDEFEDEFDDEFEDEFDDEYEDDEEHSKKKAIVFAAFGFGVLLISVLGGAAWWIFSGSSEPVASGHEPKPGVVSLQMPAAPGSLNASLNSAAGGEAPESAAMPAADAQTIQEEKQTEPEAATFASAATAPEAPAGSLNSLNTLNSIGGSNTAGGGMVIPAVASAAMGRIPDQKSAADQSRALSKAPIKALLEEKDGIGELPKIGPNGSRPWQVYARPLDPSVTQPKIALMIEGVGLSRQASLGAINKLPAEVSIVLSPYARDLKDWVFRARLAGHEVFVSLPMESDEFPLEDAGPLALDTRIQLAENVRRLDTVMASAGGYVGLVTMMGSRFMKAEGQLRQVLKSIDDRGLMFVVGGTRSRNEAVGLAKELNVVYAESEMYIDTIPRIQQIRTNLDRLESMAKANGSVIATARPYPVSIKNILDWIETIKEKGVALVPVSAVATLPGQSE